MLKYLTFYLLILIYEFNVKCNQDWRQRSRSQPDGRAQILFTYLKESSGGKNILDLDENNKLKRETSIDYEDPNVVADLMANHLSKIYLATHRKKISEIVDKM